MLKWTIFDLEIVQLDQFDTAIFTSLVVLATAISVFYWIDVFILSPAFYAITQLAKLTVKFTKCIVGSICCFFLNNSCV
jgi:hypothetical protein